MKVHIDCYPCILGQLPQLARKASPDEEQQQLLLKRLMRYVLEADPEVTPPDFAAMFHDAVCELSGVDDAYIQIKDRSTGLGLKLLGELERIARNSADPFETAVRFAIGGNIIDYGVNPQFDLALAEQQILEVMERPLDRAACAELKRRMDAAQSIFYMLDNCGEAVLDRLLIEPYADKITLGVRGKPILNDVTRRELAPSGLGAYPVVDTGDRAPGVSRTRTSKELVAAMSSADLVIAKGQGNFESMDWFTARPVFYLLRTKCPVVTKIFDCPLGSLQIVPKNL